MPTRYRVAFTETTPAFHGIQASGALSFDNSTHILTMASGTNTYWYQGTKYTTSSAITCDLDSFVTLTTNTLYFVYFDDASGTLKASASAWNLKTQVPVATVFWNGSAGAVGSEIHNYTRDLDWHINAHNTIGSRYGSGLSQTNPTTVNDALLQIESGTFYDEDLVHTIAQQTTMRGWYQASAGVYTFADYSLPYLGTSGQPQYLDTDTYTLTNAGINEYVNMWVYASNDISRPIYIIPTQASTAHATIASARAAQPPSLSGLGFVPEIKLIYKWIFRGNGNYEEAVDYRNASTLPAGGTASTTAGAVSFTPYGNISSTTVQTAIQELDDEKAPIANPTFTGDVTIPNAGLHLLDTNASHDLVIKPGSDLTADRILTVTTGDADVTLNLTAVTDEYVLAYDAGTNTWRGVAGGAGSGASTALDNLASVAINTSLISDTDNTDDLGSSAKRWKDLFTTNIGATGTRVIKGWFTDIESTNMPTVGGTAILTSLTAPQFTTIELGHASDTTLSRSAAGVLAVEGKNVLVNNAGVVEIAGSSTTAGTLKIFEDTDDGTNSVSIKAPTLAGDYTLTLPVNDGDANQVLTTDGSGVLSWTTASGGTTILKAVKTADETVNNSATYQDDDHLSVTLEANSTYIIQLCGFAYDAVGGRAPKIKFVYPASTTAAITWRMYASSDVAQQGGGYVTDISTEFSGWFTVLDPSARITINGVIITGANAGTFKIQWAQVAAGASDTKLLKGSYMILTKV